MDGPELARTIVVALCDGKVWAIKIKSKEKAIYITKSNILFLLLTLFFIYLSVLSPSLSLISNLFDYIIKSLSLANLTRKYRVYSESYLAKRKIADSAKVYNIQLRAGDINKIEKTK
jgi:hypothetical protein